MEIHDAATEVIKKYPTAIIVAWGPRFLKMRLPDDSGRAARYSLDICEVPFTIGGLPIVSSWSVEGEDINVTDEYYISQRSMNGLSS